MKTTKTWKRLWHAALALLVWVPMAFAGSIPEGTDYSQLNRGDQETSYRNRSFRAYLPLEEQSRRLKVGGLDRYENATGIYFDEGEEAVITLTGSEGKKLQLIIYNSFRHESYDLHEGRNVIITQKPGLAYIDYRSMTPQEEPPVQVQIEGGKINGVMTLHDDNATWKRLLAEAKCDVMDLMGERAHLVFWVDGLRKGCPDEGLELIRLYDRITGFIEDDLLGFELYGIHTGGHVLVHVLNSGFMSAGGDGVNLGISTFPGVANVNGVSAGAWGVSHELGHIFQTRPGMRWAGTTEITNNICAIYANYKLNPTNLRLEHMTWPNSIGERMHGSVFDCFVNNAIVQRQIWQFYSSSLPNGLPEPWVETTHSVLVSLAPFWQLLLYNMEARGQKDFYPQIYQNVRLTNEEGLTNGELRVLFCKRACDAAQLDFSDYYVKTGMLVPVDRIAQDYSSRQITVTRKMCEEAIRYASRYPKPESSVIYYITADTLPFFRDKLAVEAPAEGAGASPAIENGRMEIPASLWKNAVAFEAYAGDKLVQATLFSHNHKEKDATTVICPEGTDKVMAVQWDGTRYTVYSAPGAKPYRESEESLESWMSPRGLGIASLHEAALYGCLETLDARLNGPVTIYDVYGDIRKVEPASAEHRPQINLPNEQGDTPLHIAAAANHPHMVQALLEVGADSAAKNAAGKTPREVAKSQEVIQLLDAAAKRREEEIALFNAVRAGDEEAVRTGMQRKLNPNAMSAQNDRTLLTEAAYSGKTDIARILLQAGADANFMPPDKQTALHIAASKGNTELAKLLLEHGANPLFQAQNGATALLNAIWDNKVELAVLLLPYYKSINFSPERHGSYPINVAMQRNQLPIIKAFLDAGLDVNAKIFAHDPLLIQAVKLNKPEQVSLLLEAGAKKDAKDQHGKTAADYAKGEIADMLR